jgi:transposase
MPRYKPEERNQRRMIPVSLEMQVMPGTLEFAIDRVIDECIDVSVLDGRYKNEGVGCRAYNPRMLLKVVLLGYSRGLESSRDIELACRENVTFQAMTGGWMPDHSTIAAFVSGLTEEVKEIFCQVLLVCADEDLLGGTHFSLDGVKLPSNASKEWSGTIEELTRKEKKLRKKLDKIMEVLKATPKPHVAQGYVFRQYRTRYTACRGCPNKAKCVGTGPTERKHLDIPVGQVRKTRCQRMREKIDTERAREIYQRRFEIVEPVFGNIRAQKGLDRFTLRGKIKVSTQWMLYCLVHNLEKIAHFGASFARA